MKTLIISFILFSLLWAQDPELYTPVNIQKAFANQTRSIDGYPGSKYWQNRADYKINVEIDPNSGLINGNEKINYFNNSPDSLNELYIHLFMNIYKKGNPHESVIEFEDENEGVIIDSFSVNGNTIKSSAVKYIHNDFILNLDEPLLSAQKLNLSIKWHYTVNKKSYDRTGQLDSTTWYVAYFYPRIAVYDDIDGWNNFNYTGIAEFYNDFGDFDVAITVPRNFVVWATGMLQNPNNVLRKKYADRYTAALKSDKIIHIIDSTECTSKQITQPNAKNTWRYKAKNVTDFAFAVSNHYLWDASGLIVDKKTNRRVLIDAVYDKHHYTFYKVAQIARQAINYMSNEIPGVPYPYPNETVFDGHQGMEYPMMATIGATEDSLYIVKVTSHEIFHSYFPFYMGNNESKYAWMDEGFASFGDFLIVSELVSPDAANYYFLDAYRANAGTELDAPIIINSKYIRPPMYHYNAYTKPAAFLYILKELLGKDLFVQTLQEYVKRWHGKHPIPYDFFYTFNDACGQNLNWLFKPWFFEFGYVDLAIKDVRLNKNKPEVIIEKIGLYPAPVHLEIFYKDGSSELINRSVQVWKKGNSTITIALPKKSSIQKVELKNRLIPDADVSNNVFILN